MNFFLYPQEILHYVISMIKKIEFTELTDRNQDIVEGSKYYDERKNLYVLELVSEGHIREYKKPKFENKKEYWLSVKKPKDLRRGNYMVILEFALQHRIFRTFLYIAPKVVKRQISRNDPTPILKETIEVYFYLGTDLNIIGGNCIFSFFRKISDEELTIEKVFENLKIKGVKKTNINLRVTQNNGKFRGNISMSNQQLDEGNYDVLLVSDENLFIDSIKRSLDETQNGSGGVFIDKIFDKAISFYLDVNSKTLSEDIHPLFIEKFKDYTKLHLKKKFDEIKFINIFQSYIEEMKNNFPQPTIDELNQKRNEIYGSIKLLDNTTNKEKLLLFCQKHEIDYEIMLKFLDLNEKWLLVNDILVKNPYYYDDFHFETIVEKTNILINLVEKRFKEELKQKSGIYK